MIPTKPKRKSKKDKAAAKEKVPRRKRNEDKKRDDLLRSHFNQATINVGPVSSHLNPLLLQSGFRDIFDRTLLHWQYHSNRIRIAVNLFLRRTPFDGTLLSINDIARTVDSDSSVTTLHDLICLISPPIKYPSHEKLEAKRFPVAVYQQTIVELVGNLKSLLINNFMRVLIIRTQRLLDNAFNRPVAAGISKLLSAFLMGRRGTIVQSKDEVGLEDDPINDDNDGLDDDSLESVTILRKLLRGRRNQKKTSAGDKEVFDYLLNLLDGRSDLEGLRGVLLPSYLFTLVNNWRGKISGNSYSQATIVWMLFNEVNNVDFVQHLFPTASSKGHFTKITSTCLAAILTLYIKTVGKTKLPALLIPANLESSILLPYWTSRPDIVWNVVFPGISL